MSKAADISEPAGELEHLMADLSGLRQLVPAGLSSIT